jgi:hypothetical protein
VLGPRDEAEPGRRHHRERALTAANEPAQVVAGVVLLEPVEPLDDVAVGEHGLDSDHLVPRRPVPEHVDAARIRRDVAADRRAVACCEVDAVLPTGRARLGLDRRERRAGSGGQLRGALVDRAHRVEAAQRQDDLAAQRYRTSDEAGVAALGHDRDARRVASPHDAGDLVDVAWPHDCRGATPEAAGPVGRVAPDEFGIGEHVLGADRRPEIIEEVTRRGAG